MRQKVFNAIAPVALTADGGTQGQCQVASTLKYKAGMKVSLVSNVVTTPVLAQIQQIPSLTQLILGPVSLSTILTLDISALKLADSATIQVPEQDRPLKSMAEITQAEFDEEPTVAKRVVMVDEEGNKYNALNPIPIGTLNDIVNVQHDDIELSYDGDNNLTVAVFKFQTVVVLTLTLTYDGFGNCIRVVRT